MDDIKPSTNPPKTKIFVGRLPENAQPGDLRKLFEKYGTVTECDILNRYGFVHMATEDQAARAIENLHNCNFMGSLISVEASTGKKGGRDGPRRGGFAGRGGRGGFGPMRGGMGYGGMRSGPYDRTPGPYGRPDSYGRPDYGRPDFDRRPGPMPAGPGPIPAGPGAAAPAPAGMAAMRNGYYDDRRDGGYMDRPAEYVDRRERDAGYGMDRGLGMGAYDRGYGDYAARAAPMPASDMYGAGAYREADRSAYGEMRQPYERRDMTPREMPAARDGYERAAMAPQTYERREYAAARMGAGADMFSRRTPPPPQPAYTAGYPQVPVKIAPMLLPPPPPPPPPPVAKKG